MKNFILLLIFTISTSVYGQTCDVQTILEEVAPYDYQNKKKGKPIP